MRSRFPLLLLAGLVVLLPACGHKGDPLPPRRKTPPVPSGFRLAQRGEAVELLARAPAASLDGIRYDLLTLEFLYGEGQIDLEKAGTRLVVRTAAGEQVVKTVTLPEPGTLLRATARAVAGGERSSRSLTKALVVQAPLEAPHQLVASVVEGGVSLAWQGVCPEEAAPLPARPGLPGWPGAAAPEAPSTAGAGAKQSTLAVEETDSLEAPASPAVPPAVPPAETEEAAVAAKGGDAAAPDAAPKPRRNGFLVYRRSGDSAFGIALHAQPLELRRYQDKTAPLGRRLCYVVRAVASPDPLIESAPSNEACVEMRDITSPAAPAGLVVLPRPGGLELIWSPSGEPDLARYQVYRARAGGEPQRLAELEPGTTSYLDENAQRSVRYSYTVVAFDQAGNQSAPSAAVEAALP